MKIKSMAAALALSLSFATLNLNAAGPYSQQDLKNVERVSAVLALAPSIQALLTNEEAQEDVAWLGAKADAAYNMMSAALEDGENMMDLKGMLDAFNAADKGTIKAPAMAVIEAAINTYAQKYTAIAAGKMLPKDSQRLMRRAVRSLLCACVDVLLKAGSTAVNDEVKNVTVAKALADFTAALTKNAANEVIGELLVSGAQDTAANDALFATYAELSAALKSCTSGN